MLPFHQLPGSPSLSGIVVAQGAGQAVSLKVNLSASADPTVNDDSGDGYGIGSFWFNTTASKIFICIDATVGAATWNEVGSTTSLKELVTAANSFAAGDIIRKTGAGYTKSQADSAANAEVLGVVESASGSDFTIIYGGKINLPSHGFTIGDILFLSDATAGLLTANEPTTTGAISKPVATVVDADNLIIGQYRGMVLAPAAEGYASNTLTNANINFVRGTDKQQQRVTGTLSGPVVLNLSRSGAVQGDWFEFGIVDVVTTGTNTLTFQENGSGSLVAFSDSVTLNGSIKFVYDGSAWIKFAQNVSAF